MSQGVISGGGSSGFTNSSITSGTTVVKNTLYIVTPAAAMNLTLPSSPADGDSFGVKDETGLFSTYNVSIVRAGSEKIENVAATKILQTDYMYAVFIYKASSTNWLMT